MDNVDLNVLRQVVAWRAGDHAVVLGTITRTWGSAPRPVGSLVAVRADGQIAGSVSGGCIEDDLIARMRDKALAAKGAEVVRYGVSGDEAARFGLPCGGTLELVLEPLGAHSRVDELLAELSQGRRVRRELTLASGAVTLGPADGADVVLLNDTRLVSTHGPHLAAVRRGRRPDDAVPGADGAVMLDYQRHRVRPARRVHARRLPGDARRDVAHDARRRWCIAMLPDAHSAVIALTHDPKLDDLALMEALALAGLLRRGHRLARATRTSASSDWPQHFDADRSRGGPPAWPGGPQEPGRQARRRRSRCPSWPS
jgi:xanthine dehydrogenase accessory factor